MALRTDVETAMRISRYNATAGRLIASVRARLGQTQAEAKDAVATRIGLSGMSQSAWSAYETSGRQIPAAVLLASLDVARLNGIDAGEMVNEYLAAATPRSKPDEPAREESLAGAINRLAELLRPEEASSLLKVIQGRAAELPAATDMPDALKTQAPSRESARR